MSRKERNVVQQAVKLCGGHEKTAELTGKSVNWVYEWCRRNCIGATRDALLVAKVSGMPVEDLCPGWDSDLPEAGLASETTETA